jgi:subtilisin family serine protease
VDWVTANHAPLAVANLSLGAGASVALDTAVQNMMFSGVVTAIAAGNTNNDACLRSPARVTNAMTVGSTDPRNDNRAPTSSFGPCVDWFAPGYGITSAWNGSDTDTRLTGGTSMASPHTAGVAALYLQNHPGASQIEARDALLAFSTKGVVVYANSVNSHLLYNAETPDGFGDFTSPTASITFPADGALVQRNKNITIQAAASDSGGPPDPNGVAMVEFFVGGALICTDTTAPYTCAWKVPPSPPNAVYRLQSRVFDTAGNGYASTFVTVQAK